MALSGEAVTYRELDARGQPAGASVSQPRFEAARSISRPIAAASDRKTLQAVLRDRYWGNETSRIV
jgi:hypothetical protein